MSEHRGPLGAIAAVGLLLTGFSLSVDYPRAAGGFWSDGATYYTMAHSLAFDGDLRFGREDVERVFRVILLASLLPNDSPASETMPSLWWNEGHIPAYALLGFLTVKVMGVKGGSIRSTAILAALAVVVFGISIEIMRPFVGRMGSALNASLNTIGTLLGVSVASLAHRGHSRRGTRKTRAASLPRA